MPPICAVHTLISHVAIAFMSIDRYMMFASLNMYTCVHFTYISRVAKHWINYTRSTHPNDSMRFTYNHYIHLTTPARPQ